MRSRRAVQEFYAYAGTPAYPAGCLRETEVQR